MKVADRFSDSPETKKKLAEISSTISTLPPDTPLIDVEKVFINISTQKLGEDNAKSLMAEIGYISGILQEAQKKFNTPQFGFAQIDYTNYLEFTINKCHDYFQSWGVYKKFGKRLTQEPLGYDYFIPLHYTSINFINVKQIQKLFTVQFLKRAKLILETSKSGTPTLKFIDSKEISFTSPVPAEVKLNKHRHSEIFWFRVIFDTLSITEGINRVNAVNQNASWGIAPPKFPQNDTIVFEFKHYFMHVWYELIENFVQEQYIRRFPKRSEILNNWGKYDQTDFEYRGEIYAYHPLLSFELIANHEIFLSLLTGLIADFLYYATLARKEFEHNERAISVLLGNLTQKAT